MTTEHVSPVKIPYSCVVAAVMTEERYDRLLSQEEAGALCGLTQSTLARMEIGKACTLENLSKICKGYKYDLAQLFYVVDKRVSALSDGYNVVHEFPNDLTRDNREWITNPSFISAESRMMLALKTATLVSAGIDAGIEDMHFEKP